MTATVTSPAAPTTHTVEQVVRKQLSEALGGVRGHARGGGARRSRSR